MGFFHLESKYIQEQKVSPIGGEYKHIVQQSHPSFWTF